MRATDGLQTTITLGPVTRDDQAFSLQLSLGMSLPVRFFDGPDHSPVANLAAQPSGCMSVSPLSSRCSSTMSW